jgi:hypothetical protein
MLTAPLVVPPVTPWTRHVRVQGQRTGSTVEILVDGQLSGTGIATGPDALIPLDAAVTLAPGQTIAARQRRGTDVSVATPASSLVPVLAEPTPELLAGLYSRAPLRECATCLWLDGVVPGAEVTVSVEQLPPVTVTAQWGAVHVDVQLLGANALVKVRQGRGGTVGPDIVLPPPAAQPHQHEIPAPKIVEPLCVCDRAIKLEGVFPGAMVIVRHNQELLEACFGTTEVTFWLARGLEENDDLRITQSYPRCEIASREIRGEVALGRPPAPVFPFPVCVGDREIEVSNLREGAVIQFLVGKGTSTIVTGEAGTPPHRFILPSLGNVQELGCRQSTCGEMGPWSDTTWTQLIPLGSQDQPEFEEPVVRCGSAVGVLNLSAGTKVFVVSKAWGGWPIGDKVAVGDAVTSVPLNFALKQGDELSLELLRCGQRRRLDRRTFVQPAPDLGAPHLRDPLDDAGGTITVGQLVPGAFCDIEQLATADAEHGTLLASQVVVRSFASVAVPPLTPGMLIRARQRLCGMLSAPSSVVTVGDRRPLRYVLDSTHRICQLTGTWGDGQRPARYDTNQIGIRGTDLGVPVTHHGRLYLLFGDTDTTDELEDMLKAADPIAWTTDSPETPGGPLLNWGVGAGNAFHRLHLDGLPPLGLFEVPTGAFSYDGRMYVFVGRDRGGPHDAMQTSYLGITKEPHNDPSLDTLTELFMVSSRVEPNAPAKKWLIHVCPTVIRNADWPGLPESAGDGLLLFGGSDYHHSGLYLAWTRLQYGASFALTGGQGTQWFPGTPIPVSWPGAWHYFVGNPHMPVQPNDWIPASQLGNQEPTLLLPDHVGLGEVSVTWHPQLRRWLMTYLVGTDDPVPHAYVAIRSARNPWGPWQPADPAQWPNYFVAIFDGHDGTRRAGADNFEPGHQFVGQEHEEEQFRPRTSGPYAPYLIPAWTRFDRSTRVLTLYYTMSTEHPPYEVMLMRSRFLFR